MRQRFYGPDRDPVGRHVGDDVLGAALSDVLTGAERAAVLDRLHGAPPEQLARRIGIPEGTLERELGGLLARVRDSPHHDRLRAELAGADGPRHSPGVWRAHGHVPITRCERAGCGKPLEQKPVGRMRRYCDAKCKQAAYRQRKKTPRPTTAPAPAALSRLWYADSAVPCPYRHTDFGARQPELTASPTAPPAYRVYVRQMLDVWHTTPPRRGNAP